MNNTTVAFVCVHNSCRSQIAEALCNKNNYFKCYSAGTHKKDNINQDAVRIFKDIYGIDMEKNQKSKTLEEIPLVDIVITMGCNVECPNLPCKYREDWGLEDPSGCDDIFFIETIRKIEEKLKDLKLRVENNKINLD
ncbi:MAG: arsenate reductase ArsC [Lachnospirales bacterium]